MQESQSLLFLLLMHFTLDAAFFLRQLLHDAIPKDLVKSRFMQFPFCKISYADSIPFRLKPGPFLIKVF